MPTTIITGRDLVVTIASTNYDAQATSATLAVDSTVETYQTLDGKAYKHIDDQWTFDVSMLADWGATGSLCEALWTACETAPNTTLAVSLLVEKIVLPEILSNFHLSVIGHSPYHFL